MKITALSVTSVTNFILAAEGFFLAGMLAGKGFNPASAKQSWTVGFFLLALSAFLGGVDHGFFEPFGNSRPRVILQRATWICINVLTFFIEVTIVRQYVPSEYQLYIIGAISFQLCLISAVSILKSRFLYTLLNYAFPMILFLVLNIVSLKESLNMIDLITGLILAFIASAVQVSKVKKFSPLDNNGLYHIIMMFSLIFLYYGTFALN